MSAKPLNITVGGAGAEVNGPRAVRIDARTEFAAALRLVAVPEAEREMAARRLLAAGPRHGVDFHNCWAVFGPGGVVQQVCLAVPGSGRTGMIFLSEPPVGGDAGGSVAGIRDRRLCIEAAAHDLRELKDASGARKIKVLQALPEPREAWSLEACRGAGFIDVGTLTYMRVATGPAKKYPPGPPAWPAGISVVSVAALPEASRDTILVEALESTYVQTLDCPELCGLRETRDILDSHRSTGIYDPGAWWVVFEDGVPRGTMLLSRIPEQGAVELVYLGLAPSIRGKGIARKLMETAMRTAAGSRAGELTCAVDQRNAPAVHLYESCGLRAFSQRVALVLPLA
ncbi:MAG TPA: GNAT family N-acetyltransferase [Phycisphaerales bacterium]|nr:GNAT family N-acetyltransferase [Phycisphaerales bacterium]